MFYGPSGVGKTETAHLINDLISGKILRKQFSMFHSEKFASYLFGGSHSEGSFGHDLLDRESSVILLDEFDKANSTFHSAFYELFDSGTFEDKNYRVEVGGSVIICTSNYSSEAVLRDALGDALFSRFDATVEFRKLNPDEVGFVITRLLRRRFDSLEADEREVLDFDELRRALKSVEVRSGNVREIGKIVDDVVSWLLVKALILSQA